MAISLAMRMKKNLHDPHAPPASKDVTDIIDIFRWHNYDILEDQMA